MAINLKKNEKLSLKKKDKGLSKITVGLGWEPYMLEEQTKTKVNRSGLFGLKKEVETTTELVRVNRNIDIDATVIAYTNNKPVGECSFRNKVIKKDFVELVKHSGDNTTGHSKAKQDDEQIVLFLDNLEEHSKIDTLYVVLNIYSPRINFNQVESPYVNIYDEQTNLLASYQLSEPEYSTSNGVVVGKITRDDAGFHFKALGNGVKTTGIDKLKTQALQY